MILTARTGIEVLVERGFAAGLDGISFRTRFFGPDKGARLGVRLRQGSRARDGLHPGHPSSSRNAVYLARAIAAKF